MTFRRYYLQIEPLMDSYLSIVKYTVNTFILLFYICFVVTGKIEYIDIIYTNTTPDDHSPGRGQWFVCFSY